jgi:long-subunit fatty acid transport protein
MAGSRVFQALMFGLFFALFARAGYSAGFEYGPQGLHAVGRGGAFTAKADDPSAFYWNPSYLAKLRGTRFHISNNFVFWDFTFSRYPGQKVDSLGRSVGQPVFFAPASERLGYFPMNTSFAVATDFGLKDFGFALGFGGPCAIGKARFDDPNNMGATRYSFLDMDIVMTFLSFSGSWKYHAKGRDWFGIGATFQYAMIPWLKYSLAFVAPAGSTNQNGVANTNADMIARLDMKDLAGFSLLVGMFFKPIDSLEVAASGRVVPIHFNASGKINISGPKGSNMVFASMEPFDLDATLSFTYPMSLQAGIRYIVQKNGEEMGDIEADFVYEAWSQLDKFDIRFKESELIKLGYQMKFKALPLVRNWQDTYSVRIGGQWNVPKRWLKICELTWRLGGWTETPAMPKSYSNVDFPSFYRFGIATGLSVDFFKAGVEFGIAYAHIFQETRNVWPGQARLYQQVMQPDGTMMQPDGQAPDPYPINAGTYESGYDVFVVGLNLLFDSWFSKKKK